VSFGRSPFQTPDHTRFDVVEPSGWPRGIEQGLQLDRDVFRQRRSKRCQRPQDFLTSIERPE